MTWTSPSAVTGIYGDQFVYVIYAGGKYVSLGWTEAYVDGNLVSGPAWTAHPAWLARFLEVMEGSASAAKA